MLLVDEEYQTDEKLFCAFQNGCSESFGIIAGRYRSSLLLLAKSFVKNSHLAEDVVQETFLKVCSRKDQFDPNKKVRSWLFTVMCNTARDAIRRRACKGKHEAPEYSAEPEVCFIPEDVAEKDEAIQCLYMVLNSLPPISKDAIKLAYFKDCSYAQMSKRLDIKVGTAKSRLFNAERILRERFIEQYGA